MSTARTYAELGHFARAYEHGHGMLEDAGSPMRSATFDHRRAGKPESSTPSAADPELRWRLILSTQRLADAVRLLVPHFEDFKAWQPTRLAHTTTVQWFDRPVIRLIECDNAGMVRWKDPSDVATPLLRPDEVAEGVQQLRGLLGGLEDVDDETVADALSEADRAIQALRGAGVWSRPEQAPVCKVRACWKGCEKRGDGYRDTCAGHRKAKQRGQAA